MLQKELPTLGVFKSFIAAGVDLAVMRIAPVVAFPAAVKSIGALYVVNPLHEIKQRGEDCCFGVLSMFIGL